MDKKQKIKIALAACFVVVCGVAYLTVGCGGQGKEQIMLEQKNEEMSLEETADLADKAVEDGAVQEISSAQVSEVCVHICGAVAAEGVYTLPSGSRLTDAVAAAGGFLETADSAYHNLAAVLEDGQRVYIPTLAETESMSVSERLADTDEAQSVSHGNHSQGNKVNLNTADAEELMTLSGIGEAKAAGILEYREKVGPFQSIEELKNVSGIGDAMFERVKEFVVAE